MGYFSYLAKQYFWTAPTGERLFCPGSPFKFLAVIPDEETEKRLTEKATNLMRLALIPMFIIEPILFMMFPVMSGIGWFIGYFVVSVTIFTIYYQLLSWFMLRGEMEQLTAYQGTITPASIKSNISNRYSWPQLIALFLGCLLFVVGGIWMIWYPNPEIHPIVVVLAVLFFGYCTFNALRFIYWKFTLKDNQ
jgi:hypothetical protein